MCGWLGPGGDEGRERALNLIAGCEVWSNRHGFGFGGWLSDGSQVFKKDRKQYSYGTFSRGLILLLRLKLIFNWRLGLNNAVSLALLGRTGLLRRAGCGLLGSKLIRQGCIYRRSGSLARCGFRRVGSIRSSRRSRLEFGLIERWRGFTRASC